jgi:hypothetical protein
MTSLYLNTSVLSNRVGESKKFSINGEGSTRDNKRFDT